MLFTILHRVPEPLIIGEVFLSSVFPSTFFWQFESFEKSIKGAECKF